MEPLAILYHDEHLIAVNKPAGLLVHRTHIDRHENRFAMQMLRDQLKTWVYPIHRLDKATSGALLFAKDPATARAMTELFQHGSVQKTYLAVVRGYAPASGVIDYPLTDELDRKNDPWTTPDKPAKEAITAYRCLGTTELPHPVGRYPTARYSLVEARPQTGRTHQIRRHMAHIAHPILGDTTHGDGKHNRLFRNLLGCHRLLLAAVELGFAHPCHQAAVTIRAPLDHAFYAVITTLGWQSALPQDRVPTPALPGA